MKKLTALLFVLIKTDVLCNELHKQKQVPQQTLAMILSQKASTQLTEERFQQELKQLLLNPVASYPQDFRKLSKDTI
jgi:hypothetical protein